MKITVRSNKTQEIEELEYRADAKDISYLTGLEYELISIDGEEIIGVCEHCGLPVMESEAYLSDHKGFIWHVACEEVQTSKSEKPWPINTDQPCTCSCGGMTTIISVFTAGDKIDKRQVSCTVCGMKGPTSDKKGAAINEWNMIVESLMGHKKVAEIIREKTEMVRQDKEAGNV